MLKLSFKKKRKKKKKKKKIDGMTIRKKRFDRWGYVN